MRIHPHELAIGILGDEFDRNVYPDPYSAFDGKEGALTFLRELTEEDFGYDCPRWREWFRNCPRDLLPHYYDEYVRKKKLSERKQWLTAAEDRWKNVTARRCPECNALCPEYRNKCWVCESVVGRVVS